jgi:N-acetylmuramoyl-L-alanine amidase
MFHLLRKPCYLLFGLAAIFTNLSLNSAPVLAQSVPDAPATETPKSNGRVAAGRPLVMIDPGHGGKDPGAIGLGGLREVDVILPISIRVAQILAKSGVNTQLTRDSDYFVGLDERVVMSRRAGATIFVSIHANSIDNRPDVNGLEVYHYHRGEDLAYAVHDRILDELERDPKTPLADRGVRSARFLVLRKSDIPAILVEVGYLTHDTESLNLADPAYRNKMAEAIAAGILEYLGQRTQSSTDEQPTS